MKTSYSLAWILILATLLFSCKKDKNSDLPTPPAEGTREQLTTDSLFLYAKEVYLWYDALPDFATFNPRRFANGTGSLSNYQQELYAITQYKVNPTTSEPYEYSGTNGHPKYSYMIEGSSTGGTGGTMGAVTLADKGDDYGLALTAISSSAVYIRYVNPASPAANAGLQRGDRVLSINGTTINSGSSAFIESAFAQSNLTMSISRNGATSNVSMSKTAYTTNPVFKSTVLIAGGTQKVGYIAYSRFSVASSSKPALDAVFADFAQKGVTALVVDLRYNGGGYTKTAEELVNQIAPSSLNNQVMYVEYFNDLLQGGKAPILKQQMYFNSEGKPVQVNGHWATYADLNYTVSGNTYKFSNTGSLEGVKQVVFIVSGNTASASELVINSLKAWMPVKLVGSQTYGKPVGFFGIKIDKYTVYLSSFSMQNGKGEGDYFHGMTPDIQAPDDVTRDFGNPLESCLAAALDYITGHPSGRVGAEQVQPQVNMGPLPFTGMIEDRLKLK